MKKYMRSVSGVTLLEVMLVLAIAAMIIVMSVRYYQAATNSQQANTALEDVQNIVAAADGLAVGGGSYSAISASISTVVGSTNMKDPTGSTISISAPSATSLQMTLNMSAPACISAAARLSANTKYTATCSGGTLTVTYTPGG